MCQNHFFGDFNCFNFIGEEHGNLAVMFYVCCTWKQKRSASNLLAKRCLNFQWSRWDPDQWYITPVNQLFLRTPFFGEKKEKQFRSDPGWNHNPDSCL